MVVEYALRDVAKPIGIAEWKTRLMETLPEELKASLPTIEAIERELGEKRDFLVRPNRATLAEVHELLGDSPVNLTDGELNEARHAFLESRISRSEPES